MWLTLQFFRDQLGSLPSISHTKQMFQRHGQSMAFELSVIHGLLLMLASSAEPVIPPSLSKSLSEHLACDIMIYLSTSLSSLWECQLFQNQDCILFSFLFLYCLVQSLEMGRKHKHTINWQNNKYAKLLELEYVDGGFRSSFYLLVVIVLRKFLNLCESQLQNGNCTKLSCFTVLLEDSKST